MAKGVVIVGASAAGVATAEALQRRDPTVEVTLVGDEPNFPHDRPPLSKQVLDGSWTPEQALLLPPSRAERLNARRIFGRKAVKLDAARREVSLDDGSVLSFDDLVVATGVRPRLLPGNTPEGVHVVRTMADAQALRSALMTDKKLVIVGAGFIGL